MGNIEKYRGFFKSLPVFIYQNAKIFFVCYFLFSIHSIYAQNTDIKLDTNSILLGDQINLNLKISLPGNASVTFPQFTDTITKSIEVINTGKIDTVADLQNNTVTYNQKITITSFDSGYVVIPPFVFTYVLDKDTTTFYAQTEALLLEVRKVATNEQEDIKDLKDIIEAPLTLREILPYLLGILVLAILIILGILYFKKFKKSGSLVLIKKPQIPPHIEALSAFENLRKRKLWEHNFVKEYYSEITDILRRYIERALSINALELTTDETMEALEKTDIIKSNSLIIKQVLELSDLVKFAKYTPLPSDHEMCFNKGVEFVKNTMPAVTENNNELAIQKETAIENGTTSNVNKTEL